MPGSSTRRMLLSTGLSLLAISLTAAPAQSQIKELIKNGASLGPIDGAYVW